MKTNKRILIVGLGNPILGDDGVGWEVAQAVAALPEMAKHPLVEVDCLSLGGLSLMERLIGYERAIIIDAIQTRAGRAGEVYGFPLPALPDFSAGHTTAAHDTSLQTALQVGQAMGAQLPDQIDIVAIEAPRVYDFCTQLSPAVAAAVPVAVAAVLAALISPKVTAPTTESAAQPSTDARPHFRGGD